MYILEGFNTKMTGVNIELYRSIVLYLYCSIVLYRKLYCIANCIVSQQECIYMHKLDNNFKNLVNVLGFIEKALLLHQKLMK
jgi:hypothetical protein